MIHVKKPFNEKYVLKKHLLYVHKSDRCYKCSRCDKGFKIKAELDRHLRNVHERVKNHKCNLCEKAFTDWSKLKRNSSQGMEIQM